MLGFVWSDRRPFPPGSAIVGKAKFLFLVKEPKQSKRDNERESGRSLYKLLDYNVLGKEVSLGDLLYSNRVVLIYQAVQGPLNFSSVW